MSWNWVSQLSDACKKRVGKYLINRYLGPFLEEGILLNQLSVDGPIRLKDVALNTNYINAFLEDADLPLEFIDGYIPELSVTIPMANLLNENCLFEIKGLTLTLQVKKRVNPSQFNTSVFYSMYESFSSLNVAEDCLKQNDVTDSPGRSGSLFETGQASTGVGDASVLGVELLAEAIDSIIQRVQVSLLDTTIRIEYVPTIAPKGLALQMNIGHVRYSGEAVNASDSVLKTSTIKKIIFEDVNIFSDEFTFRRDFGTPDRDSDDQECEQNKAKDNRDPLKLASLIGRHELVVRFGATNHFGLPRSLEEVEINLGGILVHLFPHQIHTVKELISALTSTRPQPLGNRSSKIPDRDPPPSLESVMQQSLIFDSGGFMSARGGWTDGPEDDINSRSTEFMAMPRVTRKQKISVLEETSSQASPRIVLRAASLFANLIELDEGVSKLGGESSKSLGLSKMQKMAEIFFQFASKIDVIRLRSKVFDVANDLILKLYPCSQVQIVGSPISVIYEEGRACTSTPFPDDFISKTSITFGQFLIRELLWPFNEDNLGKTPTIVPILEFETSFSNSSFNRQPDLRITLKESQIDDLCDSNKIIETSVTLALNPCCVNFDPGLVDRTHLLFNYCEFDPNCLRSPESASSHIQSETNFSSLLVNIVSPQVLLNFYIPQADMRNPPSISVPDFISGFWSRNVHPEIFQIDLGDVDLTITRETLTAPITFAIDANRLAINFQENSLSERIPLIIVRKSQNNLEIPGKRAAHVKVTVQAEDLSEGSINRIGFREDKKSNPNYYASSASHGSYGTGDPVLKTDNRSGVVKKALDHGSQFNNLCVDLKLDELSIVLPSKHSYELIYNRLGNDLLLWTPMYPRVKQFLFHKPVHDPLRDTDAEFSSCVSGIGHQMPQDQIQYDMQHSSENLFDLFPKPSTPGLSIHTDTFVSLTINKGYVSICSNSDFSETAEGFKIFSALLSMVELRTAVGLERDPEICLLSLSVQDGSISFGHTISNILNVRGIHFTQNPASEESSYTILKRTNWIQFGTPDNTGSDASLLQLTSKILFDPKANLKTIDVGLNLAETSLCWDISPVSTQWITWLADFFTVVEYPVVGYIPPAILTEMKFDLSHCTIDITHSQPCGMLTLALGKVGVHCSLIDNCKDVNIGLSLEDAGLYTSNNVSTHHITAVCIADLDFLELNIILKELPRPILDVNATCNLLRLRTCSDTISHLGEVVNSIVASEITSSFGSSVSSLHTSRESSVEPNHLPSSEKDNIIPDLADAMTELDIANKTSNKSDSVSQLPDGKSLLKQSKKKTSQVFFFPDESHKLRMDSSFPEGLGMAESFHESRSYDLETSDDSLEGFCVLDAVGTGFSKNGEPTIQQLDSQPVILVENYFPVPEVSIDYLKSPKDFPPFQSRITLRKLSILWQIYGGKDLAPATSFTLIGGQTDHSLFVSTSIGKGGFAELVKTRGGPQRCDKQLIEVHLNNLSMQHEVYPENYKESSRQIVVIKSFEVRDRLETSDINKMINLYTSKVLPRQSNANMFSLKCLNLRTDDGGQGPVPEETNLTISLQPIRINIDQDTLLFLVDFFSSVFPGLSSNQTISSTVGPSSQGENCDLAIRYTKSNEVIEIDPPEVGIEVDEQTDFCDGKDKIETEGSEVPDPFMRSNKKRSQLPYIRTFIFSKDVPIRIDYSAKYLDLSQGTLAGLLTGLTSLNCSELTLKRVCYRNGIVGLDKLFSLLVTDWLSDIRQNQIPQILGGVGPMHSVIQLMQGLKDLILMPVEQYQKDGRILRGLQRGAHSFTSSTAMSLLDFTNKLLGVIKFAAELAFDIMSPEGSVVQGKLPHPSVSRRRRQNGTLRRPNDVREGVFNALAIVQEGFDETARSLAQAVAAEHSRRGLTGAVGGILRQVPSNLVRPVILATSATTNVLEGVKCHVVPETRKDEEDKWKQTQY